MKPAKPYVPAPLGAVPVVAKLALAAPLAASRPVPQAKTSAPVKAAPVQAVPPEHVHQRHHSTYHDAHERELKRLAAEHGYRAARAAKPRRRASPPTRSMWSTLLIVSCPLKFERASRPRQ